MKPNGTHGDFCPTPNAFLDMAIAAAGQDDFCNADRNVPLDVFVSSLQQEAWHRMTPQARQGLVEYVVGRLVTRLRLVADRKQYPEIAQQQIKRPLIIVGPPRSGSTLLHTLLSQDSDNMAPEHWMCLEPSPPLGVGAPTPERLETANKRLMSLFDLIPDIFVTHPYMLEEGSGALAECGSDILSMVFTSQQLWCFYRGEAYRRYLLEADHTVALGFHHDFLQHLQWGMRGQRWVLKGSDHTLWLRELAARYPDALLIWTHRDLAQQLGSLASVQSILRGLTGHPVTGEERKTLGKGAIDHQCQSLQKGMRARDAIGEDRFIDISYHELMKQPVDTVRRIYERHGLQLTDRHAAAIETWLTNNPQTKHGVHKHSPEEFDMEAGAINWQFAEYVDRFGFGFGMRPTSRE